MIRLYNRFINVLSFSEELHKLQRELNTKIDMPERVRIMSQFHPLGISQQFQKRRISLAEAYLAVISDLDSSSRKYRLRALKRLMEVALHARTLAMPLNTARVQMALMKEAVKNRNNPRRQLELLYNFSQSTHGRHQVIRRLCDRLNLIEVPETDKRVQDLDLGWDSHVHDTASTGRKNPTQLVIDAFIKGMSRLTIAYNSIAAYPMMGEALEAGRTAGVRIDIALEFSCVASGRRFHFMAVLPPVERTSDLKHFLKERGDTLDFFFRGLRENQRQRLNAVNRLVNHFNATDLKELNDAFPIEPFYHVPKIRKKPLNRFVPVGSLNKLFLGEYFYNLYKPVLHNRVLHAKALLEKARNDYQKRLISEWNLQVAERKYHDLMEEYRTLSPVSLQKRFFSNPKLGESATVFTDLGELSAELRKAGCRVRVLHPLEHGIEGAKRLIRERYRDLDEVEIYNIQDTARRDPEEILQFTHYIREFNRENLLSQGDILVPVCGSDTTGRSPTIPGMGFVYEDRLFGRYRNRYLKRHISLPPTISALVTSEGRSAEKDSPKAAPRIFCMGKLSEGFLNRTGLEHDEDFITPRRALRYLNPTLVNLVHVAVGFVTAQHFIGLFYACVWFGITGFRNMIADLIASQGVRLKDWRIKSVDFGNVSRSLFWTGFSVPILGFVKDRFDLVWPFAAVGILYNIAKFFFISFSNGVYLAAHNTFRGFDKQVVRANFFRSVFSWPLAAFAAPLGDLFGIPSIVQAKFWSDVVAGLIEGGSKYAQILNLQKRDVAEILPRIGEEKAEDRYAAILDFLKLFRDQPRSRTSLRKLFRDETDSSCRRLCHTLSEPKVYTELIDYILGETPQDSKASLVSLTAETFPVFRDWVLAHEQELPSTRAEKNNPASL